MFVEMFVEKFFNISFLGMATLNFKILPQRKKANGRLGIYISLTHRRDVRYISTEFEIDDESQWDNGRVCYRKDAAIMNKRMNYVIGLYQEKLDHLDVDMYDTCSRLKNDLIKEEEEETQLTLKDLLDMRVIELKKEGRLSYAKMNEESAKVIIGIIGNPFIAYLTRIDIKNLERTMMNRGYSNGGIQIKLSHLKAAINAAIDEKLVKYEDHPFQGFKMPSPEPRIMDITVHHFQQIKDLKTDSRRINFAKDLFLLSFYLGGINLADLIKVDLSGNQLSYIRTKTKNHKAGERMTVFAIPEEAREIICRIAPNGKIKWPTKLNYRQMLSYTYRCFTLLKEELGIPGIFSYYSARKTFAQFAFMLGVKTEVLEYCVGQSVKKNRPIYNYVRVMQHQADAAIRKVIDYTKNPDSYEIYDAC